MLVHPSSAQFGCAQRMAGHVKRWTPPQSHAGSLDTPRRCPTTHTHILLQWTVALFHVVEGVSGGRTTCGAQSCRLFQERSSGFGSRFFAAVKMKQYAGCPDYVPQTLAQNIPAISQSSGLYFVVSRSSMEAGVRLDLGGGTAMARPAPLRSPSSIRGWRESLTEVEWCQRVEPGVQRLSGCPNRQEPRRRSISR